MRARCGRCGAGFEVPAPGRYVCPACGVTNEVRGAEGPGAGADPLGPTAAPPLAPPPPEAPSRRAACPDPECGFSFIVGDVEVAPCPMCGLEVDLRTGPAAGAWAR